MDLFSDRFILVGFQDEKKEVEYLLFIYFHEEHKNLHLFELIQKKANRPWYC